MHGRPPRPLDDPAHGGAARRPMPGGGPGGPQLGLAAVRDDPAERQRAGDSAQHLAREPGLVPGAGVRGRIRDQRELRAVHAAGAAWGIAGCRWGRFSPGSRPMLSHVPDGYDAGAALPAPALRGGLQP